MLDPLSPEQLYHPCAPEDLAFETTRELEPLPEPLGQDRAMESLDFGVDMPHPGYNIYVMGSIGLGKHTLVREALEARSRAQPTPPDWCYVNNFRDHHAPAALRLPAGRARELHQDMEQLIEDLLQAIPAAFQTDEFQRRAQAVHDEFKQREEAASTRLGEKAEERGIALMHTPNGFTLAPVRDDKILGPAEFKKLSEEEQQRIQQAIEELKEELKGIMEQVPMWQRELRKRLKQLNREIVETTASQLIGELREKYAELPQVAEYLSQVRGDVIEYGDQFRTEDKGEGPPAADHPAFNRYRVNVLVDNAETRGAPVVMADNPTYQNLVGRVEHVARMGALTTDFTLIKPGALHHANGGHLVVDVDKLLTHAFSWEALKRVLGAGEIRIESLERLLSLASTISLEPEPIPVDIKVVLIGERILYYLLKHYDPHFSPLFKVAADFSEDFPRTAENDRLYARMIAGMVADDELLPMDRGAVARAIEHATRQAGDAEKLSLQSGGTRDLLREASYWAGRDERDQVTREDVQQAIDAGLRRVSQVRERLHEEILRDTLLIDTQGVQLGQVNGLSVIQLGDFSFGTPTRISATARLGSGEIIDIEREVEQGGQIHSKGVLILSSYLGRRYARHQPLSLWASLVFEQTYGEIEGDSASVAELCALLSAIGDLPLRQDLAVTGSVNQHGEVQAIGGANEKIEGFFDICRSRGLTGSQGAVIPQANLKHLMLRRDLIDAVSEGRFRIYAAHHAEQVMELLCGLRPGVADDRGRFPEGSFNQKVQARLHEWSLLRHHFAGQGEQ